MTFVAKRILFGSDGWSLDPETFPIIAQCYEPSPAVNPGSAEP